MAGGQRRFLAMEQFLEQFFAGTQAGDLNLYVLAGHLAVEADQLAGQFQRQLEAVVFRVEVEALDLLLRDSVHRPAPDEAGQHLRQVTG
jgi:hypothetical protein